MEKSKPRKRYHLANDQSGETEIQTPNRRGRRSQPHRDPKDPRRSVTNLSDVSDAQTDQWPDIMEEPSDLRARPISTTSCWSRTTPRREFPSTTECHSKKQSTDTTMVQDEPSISLYSSTSTSSKLRKEDVAERSDTDATASLFLKFPPFIEQKQLQYHIEKYGFGDNIVDIEMHIKVSNRKPAGSAKLLIRPPSLQEEFISSLDGSRLVGKHCVSVEPYLEQKQSQIHRRVLNTKRQSQPKESRVVFVRPILPHYINTDHIRAHFRECEDAITDIEFKGDKRRRGCYVLLTFKSASSAMKAVERYNRTYMVGKHKIKVDLYKPHSPMSSSASCPTMQGPTDSTMHTYAINTKSNQASSILSTEVAASTLEDDTYSLGTFESVTSKAKHLSAGPHFMGELSSSRPIESGARERSMLKPVKKEFTPNLSDSEDQLQNIVTTVVVKNLDPNVTQKEIEVLTGVNIVHYTPSHLTPEKVAAWIEVANSKYAYSVAEKLNGRIIHGKELYCSLIDSRTLQQYTYNFPTFKESPEEQLSLSQPLPPSYAVQPEYLTLFFVGDKSPLQESQMSFFQDPNVPFVIPSNPPLPISEPKPPIPLNTEMIIDLQQQQWNYLTNRHESGATILQEIIAPFETNPNVKIQLQLETCSIKIYGVADAVDSACDHITNQLNKDLHVQNRTKMAALIHFHPTLPQDIAKRHKVTVSGFQQTSTVIRFEGSVSAVKTARTEVDKLFSQIEVTLLTPAFPHSLLSLAKTQLSNDECKVYISVPEMMEDSTASFPGMISVCAINEKDHKRAVTLLQSTPTEKEVILPYAIVEKVSVDECLKQVEEKFCILIKRYRLRNNGDEKLQQSQLEDDKLTIIGFHQQNLKHAHEELLSLIKLHSEQTVTLDCKPEEVIYLLRIKRKESRSLFSSLPAKVTIEGDVIQLYGSIEIIKESKDRIHSGLLLDLQCRRFPFQCNLKFLSQIEDSILKPLKSEQQLDFQSWIIKPESQKSDKQPKSEQYVEPGGFEIIIYSKDKLAFDKVCEALEVTDPQTVQFQLTYHQRREAADCVRKIKGRLEAKYYVRIIVLQSNSGIIIHGLIPHEIQNCWEDINTEIKATIDTTKYVSLKRHESKYLERKCCDDLKKEFSCDIAFPQQRNNENYSVRLVGKIKDVEAVENKVLKLIEAGIQTITFTITCSQKSYSMWRKWWFDLRKKEENVHDLIIHFDATGKKISRDGRCMVEVTFEVIGTDKGLLISIRDTINNEKSEQRVFDVLEEGKVALINAIKQQRLPISDKLAIAIDVNPLTNKVMLVSPRSLSDDLNTAESEIRKFVGMYASISKEVTSQDPVIGLILASQSLSGNYLRHANDIAKPHKVTVIAMGAPLFGLKLTGSPSAIQKVVPQIHAVVFKQVERIVSQTVLQIPSNRAALLTTSEFSHVETKFQSDYCVVLSYPRPGLLSKAVHTTIIRPSPSSHSLQLDICLGNIVHERVDAIVNAANEDLKHIGGLAKGILDNGGVTIQSESNQYIQLHGKVLTGTCVCLGAGKLPCKRVIHAVGPQWRGGGKGEEQALYTTVYKCLQCADKESLRTIALPAISTGVYGVPEVVCARSSLTAIQNYCQSTPNSGISKVRFVLYTKSALQHFGSTFKHMFPSQSLESTQSIAITSTYPEVSVTWSWSNDQGSFSSYTSDISAQLTKEYKRDPTSSVNCTINDQQYCIDFTTMTQTNRSTGYRRKVKRVSDPQVSVISFSETSQRVHWEYKDDHHRWSPYKSPESQAIEEMYQDKTPGELSIRGNTYTFDFIQMYQINIRTKYKRQIQRTEAASSDFAVDEELASEQREEVYVATTDSASKRDDNHSKDDEVLTITLRGPRDTLLQAKTELQEKLKSLYVSHVIAFPPTLEKRLIQLVKEHNVTWSLEKSGSAGKRNRRRRKIFKLNIEGLASEVTSAVMAINEEIVTHQVESESDGAVEYPEEWEDMADATTKIIPLNPGTEEYRRVSQKFQQTMPSSRIIQITRIQNKWQWEKYDFQRKRMKLKNDGKINELELFHGTRTNDPKVIYENEVGFDMRYSNAGMWGQANYFAEKASYSNSYAHTTGTYVQYREMFFAKVLTGDSFDCRPDSTLRKPPFKPTATTGGTLQFAQVQYDTVTGYTSGSQVYMTYDNDKAYPAYLIKYQ